MKKFIALFAALMMLFSVCALAEEAPVTLYTAEDGTAVTLTMKGEYTITEQKYTESGETLYWVVSREGVADVYIIISPLEGIVSLNDLLDNELDEIITSYVDDYGDVVTVTLETTPSGNKYFDCFWDEVGGQMHERWTYFEGFELSRLQFSDGEVLTDADTAFLAEVQEGMWVVAPEKAE